jgi:hypothetical protein
MSDIGAPLPPPGTPGEAPSTGDAKKAFWKRWWALAGGVVVALIVIAGIAGGGGDESDSEATSEVPEGTSSEDGEAPEETDRPDETESTETPEATDAPTETDAPVETDPPTSGDAVAGAPAGAKGDRSDPVPSGAIADIGDGFRLQVLSVTDDATTLVLAENQFNDPPPAGSRFTVVEVALGNYGFDDPQSGFMTSIQAVASENTELDTDCGVTPNDLNLFNDIFSGGTIRGNLCFVTTPADTGTIQLYASTGFTGDSVFLDASATPTELAEMPPLVGVQPGTAAEEGRTNPTPIGTSADVGEGWSLALAGPATDITDAVLAENQFNEPPPEGSRFVGLPVRMAYSGDGTSNAFTVTISSVGNTNLQYSKECGVTPGELDTFADIFAGGVAEGQVCFVVPVEDLGTMTVYAGALFDDVVFFATQ